ncbi:MAG: hypothetical protein C5B47_05295 [Verrucomicrobia bacterium]|nr:MAG: hypothetical protein C5B47_05295 [Verrucomicrobiota bacterium]
MRWILCVFLLILAWDLNFGRLLASPLPTPQRSVSRQFVIYGKRKDLVAYAMRRAEDLASRWNALFQPEGVNWRNPIIIRLVDEPSARRLRMPFKTKLLLTDDHQLKVQLDVPDWGETHALEFDWRVLQALALRNAYAAHPPSLGSQYRQPPAWIIDGALQEVLKRELGDFIRSHVAALAGAQPLDLKGFLAENPEMMDAVSRTIYRVKARALLQALTELPAGSAGICSFLSNPAAWDGTPATLLAYFPALKGNVNTLVKVWGLNLVRPTVLQRALPLTLNETAQRLDAVLSISLPQGVKIPKEKIITKMEAFRLIATAPQYQSSLRGKAQDLLLLSLRANPMYRPLIDEYRGILETLLRNPRKNVQERIQDAEKRRRNLNQQCGAIEDYLNWFDTLVRRDESSPFQSILENDQRRRAPPWRSDAVSHALDTAEAAGW